MIETTRTIEIEGSSGNYLLLVLCAVLMAIVAIAIALPASPGLHDSFAIRLVFYSIAAFFLLCAAAGLRQIARNGTDDIAAGHPRYAHRDRDDPVERDRKYLDLGFRKLRRDGGEGR